MTENAPTQVRYRAARAEDAGRVAALHAATWRRHYRGAYADSFLDGDVVADRRTVWSARLAEPDGRVTVLAEDGEGLVGFVHVVLDADDEWGSLVDNLHVSPARQRTGVGSALLAHAGQGVIDRAASPGVYLWVLEQNTAAQRFYLACGGADVGKKLVSPPGGVPSRLNGTPTALRITWEDAAVLARRR